MDLPGTSFDYTTSDGDDPSEYENGTHCGCGQCEIWASIVETGRNHRVFSLREWAALVWTFADLLHDGPSELSVQQWLDPIPDSAERKIRERVDGQVGKWFDGESTIAHRSPETIGCDLYRPMSTIERFDSPPTAACDELRSALGNQKSRSLFDRLNQGEPRRPPGRHTPDTDGHGSHTMDGSPGAETGTRQPTATGRVKGCAEGQNQADNRRSERSDRVSPTMAFGRDSGVEEVIDGDGIHFDKSWSIPPAQAEMIEAGTRGLTAAAHHFFCHAVRSTPTARWKNDGWFPFYFEHIKAALPCTEEEARKTELVWKPLVERGLIDWRPADHENEISREYKVDEDWMEHFHEAFFQDDDEPMVDAFTGAPRPDAKRETALDDHNDHKYKGSLLQGLKTLKDATRRFNKQAIEDLLVHKKRKVQEAKAEVEQEFTADFKEYKQAFFDVHHAERARNGWSGTQSFEQWKLVYPGQRRTEAYLRYQQRRESYMNDLRCYASILRQRPRPVEGEIYEYDTAWEAQKISGRVSEIGGGLQSGVPEMKAAAYEGVEAWNYDIVGSQLGDVITATEMVPSIDTAGLEEQYQTAAEAGGDPKTENAKALGIERDTYKSLLYATTFVGSWAPDAETALAQANVVTGVPQTLKILRQAAWQNDIDAEAAYGRAQSHFLPLKKAVRKLADYLLTTYWEENKYNAGGWVMRNACGVAFRKEDYEDASTHKKRSKVLAWFLQGAEADKMHRLAARSQEEGIGVMGNEHDGLVTASPIPEEIQDEVLKSSELERKPFEEYRIDVDPEADEAELERLRDDIDEVVRKRQEEDQE